MDLVKLDADYQIKPFDCGDADLNGFLLNDAKDYAEKNLAYTFIFDDGDRIAAYYSLLNDKVSKSETNKASWRKMKKHFPHEKHFNSYPAIKIGRFAVDKSYEGKGLGRKLMTLIKENLAYNKTYSAFRFLTVDAYISAVPFYEKNGFRQLVSEDENKHTRLMYFDMMEL